MTAWAERAARCSRWRPACSARSSRHGDVAVRLTEVEAYDGPIDPGSHAYRGQTAPQRGDVRPARPAVLLLHLRDARLRQRRHAAPRATASAVLLRAGEVVDGIELARERRPSSQRPRPGPRAGPAVPGARHRARGQRHRPRRRDRDAELGEPVADICTGPRVGSAARGRASVAVLDHGGPDRHRRTVPRPRARSTGR